MRRATPATAPAPEAPAAPAAGLDAPALRAKLSSGEISHTDYNQAMAKGT